MAAQLRVAASACGRTTNLHITAGFCAMKILALNTQHLDALLSCCTMQERRLGARAEAAAAAAIPAATKLRRRLL